MIDLQNPGLPPSNHRIAKIDFDEASISRANPNVEHERQVAVFDLLEQNRFEVVGRDEGPYLLTLGISEDRLVLTIAPDARPHERITHLLSLTPLRRILKDYMLVCDSYYQAICTAPPSKIQAIDMGRRGLHNDGARVLTERLAGKIEIDNDTARRLFTVIVSLHWKG